MKCHSQFAHHSILFWDGEWIQTKGKERTAVFSSGLCFKIERSAVWSVAPPDSVVFVSAFLRYHGLACRRCLAIREPPFHFTFPQPAPRNEAAKSRPSVDEAAEVRDRVCLRPSRLVMTSTPCKESRKANLNTYCSFLNSARIKAIMRLVG